RNRGRASAWRRRRWDRWQGPSASGRIVDVARVRGKDGDACSAPSEFARGKRVALSHVAAGKPGLEPGEPLRGGPMRKRIRHDIALRLLLDAIVAHRRSGGESFLDVAGVELVALLREIRPRAGVAVGLQLETHRQRVVAALVDPLPSRVDLLHHAGEVLHMMADFVRDHEPLRKTAGSPEAPREFVEESRIQVELAVPRAVERSDGSVGNSTRGAYGSRKEHERRRLVGRASRFEYRAPHILGVAKNAG